MAITINKKDYDEVIKLLTEAEEGQRINIYSKYRVQKAIQILTKKI